VDNGGGNQVVEDNSIMKTETKSEAWAKSPASQAQPKGCAFSLKRRHHERILTIFLSVLLLMSVAVPAFATGDPNIDGGGGAWEKAVPQVTGTQAWTASRFLVNAETHAVVGSVID
jgi:hypothetical protein